MAESTTIARPYAQAAFELARSQKRLKEWSDMLGFCATVANDPQMKAIVANPRVQKPVLAQMFIDLGGKRLDNYGANLIKLLAQNGRLKLLPEIASLFDALRADAERTVQAKLISAVAVDKTQQARIAASLKKRLGREVNLTCQVNESLVGGAIVRAGDLVIDGSVASQLKRLAVELSR